MGYEDDFLGIFIANPQILLEKSIQAGTLALREGHTVLQSTWLRLELPKKGSQHLSPLLDHGRTTFMQALRGSYVGINIAAASLLTLLLWRLWRFTIRPLLNPHQPRELPYWIPMIGKL